MTAALRTDVVARYLTLEIRRPRVAQLGGGGMAMGSPVGPAWSRPMSLSQGFGRNDERRALAP